MGYQAYGTGYISIDRIDQLEDVTAKWKVLLNTPVLEAHCKKCSLAKWKKADGSPYAEGCTGPHPTLFENKFYYAGGEALESYESYDLKDIFQIFGWDFEDINQVYFEDQKYHDENIEILCELLEGFCKEGDYFEFSDDSREYWKFHYADGSFTRHDARVEILYPTLDEVVSEATV